MAEIKDFVAPALQRSFDVLRDVVIRFDAEDLVIGLRAFGGFRPLVLQDQAVVLKTHTLDGWRDIRGSLVHDPRQPRHGTWYNYRFVPDSPNEKFLIIDSERCHWTNVERVEFVSPEGVRFIRNRLYRPEAGTDAADVR